MCFPVNIAKFLGTPVSKTSANDCLCTDLLQKQPPEVFYVKKCSEKFRKIHRKTPVPEPQACNFIKKETLAQVFSCEFCETSKSTFFTEHLWTTASAPIS